MRKVTSGCGFSRFMFCFLVLGENDPIRCGQSEVRYTRNDHILLNLMQTVAKLSTVPDELVSLDYTWAVVALILCEVWFSSDGHTLFSRAR